jgi:DNA polymerase-3 subunit alpha
MGKKDPKVMAKQRDAFMEGARAQKVNEKKAAKIFELMEYFAGYGFNKSHSTAYAFLAYQTAYLKANYPWHFAAALLTIESNDSDKLAVYLAECRERNVPLLQPDINASLWHFSVEKGRGVRFGLGAIKGLGEGAVQAIVDARTALGGRITSLHALCEVLDLRTANKRVFEALVKSGACDSLLPPADAVGLRALRAKLFASLEPAMEHGSRTQRDKDLGQADLFGGGSEGEGPVSVALPDVPAWTEIETLNFEKESLGLYWSGHPVDRFAADLVAIGAKTVADLLPKRESAEAAPAAADEAEEVAPGPDAARREAPPPSKAVAENVLIGGIVGSLRPLKTRKGDRMCVFMLDDPHGSLEIVVFPEAFKQHGHLAENGRLVVVKGRFERDDESARLLAEEISPIELVSEKLATSVAIKVSTPPHGRATFERLWDVLAQHKGDRCVAFDIELQQPGKKLRVRVDVNAQIRVRPSEGLVSDVEKICGAGSVVIGRAARVVRH